MKNINKKARSILIILVILGIIFISVAVFSPIIVNKIYLLIYTDTDSFQMEQSISFSSGELIGYLGAIIGGLGGALLAIMGVYWTIKNNNEAIERQLRLSENNSRRIFEQNREFLIENQRLDALPLIVLNEKVIERTGSWESYINSIYEREKNQNANVEELDEKNAYHEVEGRSFLFVISENNIKVNRYLTQEQATLITTNGLVDCEKNIDGKIPLTTYIFGYFPLQAYNGGRNTAVNIIFRLYKNGYEDNTDFNVDTTPISLLSNSNANVNILLYDNPGTKGDYMLEITYSDIFKNRYLQQHQLVNKENRFTIKVDIDQVKYIKEAPQ